MSFEIVDGMTGQKHISSDDLSALNVATIGKADCVLKYGDDFKLTMQSANSATLGTGVGMVGGKRFWNQAATSLTVQSGTQGQKRNDLIVARYAKTSAGIESITPVVIKGTPTTGTAADPEVTANDLKLWRVPLDGISVGEPVKLFEPVASLATLGDSVSYSTIGVWNVVRVGKAAICTRRERQAVFQGGNEYIRFWTGDFPFEFTEPPTVAVTFAHGDESSLGVTPSIKMDDVGKSDFVAAIYTHTGSLPSQVKLGFDVIAVGVQG